MCPFPLDQNSRYNFCQFYCKRKILDKTIGLQLKKEAGKEG